MCISPTGSVDLAPLVNIARSGTSGPPKKVATQWCVAIFGSLEQQDFVIDLHMLLQVATLKMTLKSLLAQFLLAMSLELDKALGSMATNKTKEVATLRFRWDSLDEVLEKRYLVERTCAQHVVCGLGLAAGHRQFHLAVDKGWAGSLPLQFGFLTMPNNQAVLLAPQVIRVCPGSRRVNLSTPGGVFSLWRNCLSSGGYGYLSRSLVWELYPYPPLRGGCDVLWGDWTRLCLPLAAPTQTLATARLTALSRPAARPRKAPPAPPPSTSEWRSSTRSWLGSVRGFNGEPRPGSLGGRPLATGSGPKR